MKTKTFFDRHELRSILSIYGRMVAAGEWRDYAMDAIDDYAVFSIYRRTSERPLFQVEKRPGDAQRQGAYCVRSAAGQILRRGHDLSQVLKVLEPRRLRLIGDLAPA
jgi:hypothetical protein